jgi:hypothetical protein
MKEHAIELCSQCIEMAAQQQEELYKYYHLIHKDQKTQGETALLFHLKILKNLIEEIQIKAENCETLPTPCCQENPSLEFSGCHCR